jgi:hypothetical protein
MVERGSGDENGHAWLPDLEAGYFFTREFFVNFFGGLYGWK